MGVSGGVPGATTGMSTRPRRVGGEVLDRISQSYGGGPIGPTVQCRSGYVLVGPTVVQCGPTGPGPTGDGPTVDRYWTWVGPSLDL